MTTQQFGGEWTVEKLEILRLYLDGYTTALKNQPFNLIYIDPFAGAGEWSPMSDHETEEGSATIALKIDDKPFDRLVFIDSGVRRNDGWGLGFPHRLARRQLQLDAAERGEPGAD